MSDPRIGQSQAPPRISAQTVFELLDFRAATRAIQGALRDGLDPATDFSRSILEVEHGQLLLMPSQSARFVGVKVASVAPANPSLGRERIQGVYLLADAATLTPQALIDGTALTTLRTPAVSAAIADHLAPADIEHLVVFGTGPQALAHIHAMRAIRTPQVVSVVGSSEGRAAAAVERLTAEGVNAREGLPSDVRDAQLIVCATTAAHPLFDGASVPDDSCTIAVGSHSPDAREFDSALAARAQLVVEDTAVALRESGEVAIPVAEGVISAEALVPMRQVITGEVEVARDAPRAFTSSGMSWEDLVVASAVYERALAAG